jgi:Tfp pilus assembly protein PilX
MIDDRRPSRRGRGAPARRRAGDRGTTLIEVIVAVLLLGLIVTPVARIVIETGSAANQYRLRTEASDVATDVLENVENQAYFGTIDPTTTTTTFPVTENGQNQAGANPTQDFSVTTSYTVRTGTDETVCQQGSGGTVGNQIWEVTVSVAWPGDGTPLVQTTYLAPEQAGAVPSVSGEIAVPVDSSAATPTPYTASSVPITVVGTWDGGGSPQRQSGTQIFATGSTGSTGCAVFDDLDPTPGWTWTVYLGPGNVVTQAVSNQSSLITPQLQPGLVNSATVTQSTVPDETVASIQVGTPVVAGTFQVDPGDTVSVSYAVQNSATVTCPAQCPADLPVSVQANPQLQYTNNTFAFDTVASGTQISTIQLWPGYNDYLLWPGDTQDSWPLYTAGGPSSIYPGAEAPPGVDTTQPGPYSVTLPLYATEFKSSATPTAGVQLTATEVDSPSETFDLSAFASGNVSATGLPLGQYVLGATSGSVTPAYYFWVTATAVYYGTSEQSTPTGFTTSEPPGTPITLTSVT